MKHRVFYVLHLDRGRIWVLATLFVSTLLFAFATGFRVGAVRSPESTQVPQATLDLGEDTSLRALGADDAATGDVDDLAALSDTDPRDEDAFAEDETTGSLRDSARADAEREVAEREAGERDAAERRAADRQAADRATAERKASEQRRIAAMKAAAAEAERKAQKRETAAVEKQPANPRSALLESGNGVKMSNIAETPRTTEAKVATESRNQPRSESPKEKSRKTHSLQIAAFRTESAANRMMETLKKQGFHPYIVKSKNNYLVRVGRSDSVKELWPTESKLREKQYSPMRVSQ